MIKKILLGLGGLVLVLLVVVIGRTLALPGVTLSEGEPASLEADQAAANLSDAVRFVTISYQAGSDPALIEASHQAMVGFRDWLSERFPSFAGATSREIVSDYSLLYTWQGSDPSLKPVLLMSHMDVVPIAPGTENNWEQAPFAGTIADGFVWGRGTIDTKGSLVAMVMAADMLAAENFQPKRTIMFAFGHDEEIGGGDGNKVMSAMLAERGIELEWVADEGGILGEGLLPGLPGTAALIGIAEKGSVSLDIVAASHGGHSSMPSPVDETAIGRLTKAIDEIGKAPFESRVDGASARMIAALAPAAPFMQRMVYANMWLFEPVVRGIMEGSPSSAAQLHTTIAPTIIEGGNKENVLPPSAHAVINFRTHPRDTGDGIVAHVKKTVADDPDITVVTMDGMRPASPVSNVDGPGYKLLSEAISASFPGVLSVPNLTVGGTDSRFYTGLSDNVFRFIPIRMGRDDLPRFHGTNERVSVANMGQAVAFYKTLMELMNKQDQAEVAAAAAEAP